MNAKISKVRFVDAAEKYTGPAKLTGGHSRWTPTKRERVQVHVTAGGIEQFLFDYYPDASTLKQADLKRMLIGVSVPKALELIQRRAANAPPRPPPSAAVRAYFGARSAQHQKQQAAVKQVVDEVLSCNCWKFVQGTPHKPHEPHCEWLKMQPPEVAAREAERMAEGKACTCGKFPDQWWYEHDMGAHKPDCGWLKMRGGRAA